MASCPECNASLGVDAKFCQSCGSEVGSEQSEKLGANQQYCPSCGEIISAEASACPHCGYGIDTNEFNDEVWIAGGVVSLIIGFIVFAIIFAPIAMLIGFKLYSERDDWVGPAIIVIGVLEFVVWGYTWLTMMGMY